MKLFFTFVSVLCIVYAHDVPEYTDSNFEDRMSGHDIALVKFYAPWCGHCKRLAPDYEKAAGILRDNDPPVALIKVDCTEGGKETCNKYGVSGYPTLKIFKGGAQTEDYNGPRDADGIVKYMRSKAGPSSKALTSLKDVEKFVSGEDHAIVGFFKSSDSALYQQFLKLADSHSNDYRFAHTFDSASLEKYGYTDDVVIFQPPRLQSKMEDSQVKYTEDATLHKLKTWLVDNVHGLVGHRTRGNEAQFKRPLVIVYYDVDYTKNAKGTNYWRNRVIKVAKSFRDNGKNVHFAISSKTEFANELTEHGLKAEGDKPLVAGKDTSDRKFSLTEEFSPENLEKFVSDFLAGNLEPFLKSEPIPTSDDGNVKVVVAKNFNEIVQDPTKNVLIEFYAPWCGHCKSLAPKYEELATKLKDEPDVVIAKIDATANDVPKPYEVRGFPTIYFAPKGNKSNPKKYEGEREVKDFIKFIARESTDPLQNYDRDGKKIKKEL